MGCGIKEPRDFHVEVTGTIVMALEKESHEVTPVVSDEIASQTTNNTLKTTKNGIILHPQPQDNPNDPLNWPIWRRDTALLVLGFHCFVGGGQTAMLAAGLTKIAEEFDVTSSQNSYLVGAMMLALAFGSLFAAPTAILFGKRCVYLAGILIFFCGAIWAANAKTWNSLLGARILMGIGVSPCESLPSSTIAEIYFAHERAYRLGIYTMLLLGGKNLVPMLASFVFQQLDRQWLFWILTIILGINFVLTFFFVPETFWDREPTPDKRSQEESERAREIHDVTHHTIDHVPNEFAILAHPGMSRKNTMTSLNSSMMESSGSTNEPVVGISDPTVVPDKESQRIPKNSFSSSLRLFSGRHTNDKWWMVFCRPFVLMLYPSVLFGAFLYTFAVVWLILISETISHIFTNAPYKYSQLVVGLFYISPFLGGTLGSMVAGRLSDVLTRYIVGKNKGIYEPEFRLVMCLPIFIAVFMGLLGFGWASQAHDIWIGPVMFFGVLGFGCSLASTTAITYTVDSYKMFAAEALVTLNVMKNVMGFLFSLFNNSFVDNQGSKNAFLTFGCIQLLVCACSIPLYFFGKRARYWTDQREFMRWFYVVEEEEEKADVDNVDDVQGVTNGAGTENSSDTLGNQGDVEPKVDTSNILNSIEDTEDTSQTIEEIANDEHQKVE